MKGIYFPSLLSLLEIYQHILEISQPKWCIMFAVNGIISLSPSWIYFGVYTFMGFPGGSNGNELPSMQETWVQFLGQKDPWRRKWKPTPVLTGKSHRQRTLAGYSPWVAKSRTWLNDFHSLTHIKHLHNLNVKYSYYGKKQIFLYHQDISCHLWVIN